MNIVFLGKFFPQNMLKTIKEDSKGKIGLSNHNFEMSIVNGLCQQDGIELRCISIPGVFSYPHNNRNLFTRSESYVYHNRPISSVGFCNMVGIKERHATYNCVKLLEKEIDSFPPGTVHVIINTPDLRLLHAINTVKNRSCRKITETVIIPDIPSMVTSMDKHFFLKKLLLERRDGEALKRIEKSDGLVLLTEAMMDFVDAPVKHIVMEGIVDIQSMDLENVDQKAGKKIILYTGTLRRIFGVMNLVSAFQMIPNDDVELWICGSGDAERAIASAAQGDFRIKFFGLVDSKLALEMQHKATILVNPRTSEGEYTKYSFPSKTMEYLLAGKSVVINHLPGIPDEYFNYVYTPKNECIDSLAECLLEVLNLDDTIRDQRADAGRQFIIKHKNSKVQMARVIELIRSY